MSGDLLRRPGGTIIGPGVFACTVHAIGQGTGHGTGSVLVRLTGELDLATAPDLAKVLSAAVDAGVGGLVVDLTDLRFIDSNGIHVLLAAGHRARADGFPMTLRNPTRQVLKLLQLTGVDQLMPISRPITPGSRGRTDAAANGGGAP